MPLLLTPTLSVCLSVCRRRRRRRRRRPLPAYPTVPCPFFFCPVVVIPTLMHQCINASMHQCIIADINHCQLLNANVDGCAYDGAWYTLAGFAAWFSRPDDRVLRSLVR